MSAAIQPLHVLSESLIDCIILLASGIVLFLFAFTKKTMSRWEGAACILMYVGYTAYLLSLQMSILRKSLKALMYQGG